MLEWFGNIDISKFWGYLFVTVLATVIGGVIVYRMTTKKGKETPTKQTIKTANINHKKGDRVTYNVNNDTHPKKD